MTLGHIQAGLIHVVVVLRVGGSELHQFQKGLTSGLRGVLQSRQSLIQRLIADRIRTIRNLAGLMRAYLRVALASIVVFLLQLFTGLGAGMAERAGGGELAACGQPYPR